MMERRSCKQVCGVGLVLWKQAIHTLTGWNPDCYRIIRTTYGQRSFSFTHQLRKQMTLKRYVLQTVTDDIPRHDLKTIIGNMNAQFSCNRQGFKDNTGPFRSSKHLSDNGEWLMTFCIYNNLCIGNTFFQHKLIHKMTWCSSNGLTFNEIDHFCISRKWRAALQDVRVFRVADVGSDHNLVCINIKLKLQ